MARSVKSDAFNHHPGQLLLFTGSIQLGRPTMGAWALYGLGSESQDLPAFVVFSTGAKGTSGGAANWGCGFLPTPHNGTLFRTGGDTTVRGYEFESLGVKVPNATVGGRYLAIASAEVDHYITPQWGLAAFVDAGDRGAWHKITRQVQDFLQPLAAC